jgi:hypothetical protein
MRYATSHGIQAQISLRSHTSLYPEAKRLEWFRATTAIGATGRGSEKFGRVITGPLQPRTPGRLSVSQRWATEWLWVAPSGIAGNGTGLIATGGSLFQGDRWWFDRTDGIYLSDDGGATVEKVTSQS